MKYQLKKIDVVRNVEHIDFDLFIIDPENKRSSEEQVRHAMMDALTVIEHRLDDITKKVNLLIDEHNEECPDVEEREEKKEKLPERKMIRNRIKCLVCGDIIESKSQHDFVHCTCGHCYVDGGTVCPRIGGNYGDWEDASVWEELEDKK